MKRASHVFAVGVVLLGACSLINAPEDLKTDAGGGTASAGTSSGAGKAGSITADGGTQNDAGASMGLGGCSVDCPEGGAPPLGRECDDSAADCGSTAPICDATLAECRACGSDQECNEEVSLPYCLTAGASTGRCVEGKTDTDCSEATPVCSNLGRCRACAEDDECESGVCGPAGACATTGQVVYVLAQTGDFSMNCGTIDLPCRSLSTAATKLSAQRPNLVFIKTPQEVSSGNASLPAIKGMRVIGNDVVVRSPDGESIFRVPAEATVVFDRVHLEGSTVQDEGAIECTGGSITVANSTLKDNGSGVLATDCDVTVVSSAMISNANPLEYGHAALSSQCTVEGCTKTLSFLRNRFVDNGVAVAISGQADAVIENNLFLRNGTNGYTRVINLRAQQTRFAYNTLVQNFNNCIYIGIVACNGATCNNIANISHDNFPGQDGCYDQVWYNGTLTYSLTEITYPGATNKTGDPLFVDPANGDFTPGPGSPALDNADPADAPMLDLRGRKRPVGGGPDIGAFEAQ